MNAFYSHLVVYFLSYIAGFLEVVLPCISSIREVAGLQPQNLPNHYTNKEGRFWPPGTTAHHTNWGKEVINDNKEAIQN